MDVRMPDGTIVKNVPENITKSELMRRYFGETQTAGVAPPSSEIPTLPGLKAQQMFLSDVLAPTARFAGEKIGQGIAAVGGGINKLSSGAIGEGLEYLGQTPPAQAAARGLEYVGEQYGDFKEAMPETAQTLEDAVAVFQFMPGMMLIGKGKAIPSPKKTITYADSKEIRNAATKLYKEARQTGATYSDDALSDFAKSMQAELPKSELGRAVAGGDEFSDTVTRFLQNAKDEVLDLDSFEEMDKALGAKYMKAVGSQDFDTARKFANAQGDLRRIATSDNYLKGSKKGIEAYRDATKLWSAQARLREIEDIIDFADTYPQPQTYIKNAFRIMAKNPKRLKGYTPEQVKAINKAAKTGIVDDALSTFGSRLIGVGSSVVSGPLGGLIGMGGSGVARIAAQARKGAEATNIGRMIQEQAAQISPGLQKSVIRKPMNAATVALPAGAINLTAQELEQIMQMPPNEARAVLESMR